MKKVLALSTLFLALLFAGDLSAQDPTVKKEDPVVSPEKKDSERSKAKKTTATGGTSDKISIEEEGDASTDRKKNTGNNDGKSTKDPVVTPNGTRNPKK